MLDCAHAHRRQLALGILNIVQTDTYSYVLEAAQELGVHVLMAFSGILASLPG